jgi:hypothetical protein
MEDTSGNNLFFNEEQDEQAIFNSKMAFQIKLVLLFENGKIDDIRVPKRTTYIEKAKDFKIKINITFNI